jgi:hypothetical protein
MPVATGLGEEIVASNGAIHAGTDRHQFFQRRSSPPWNARCAI